MSIFRREKAKQKLQQLEIERFETLMLPENIRWRNIISAVEA